MSKLRNCAVSVLATCLLAPAGWAQTVSAPTTPAPSIPAAQAPLTPTSQAASPPSSQAVAPAAGTAAQPPAQVSSDYVIGPGDTLQINVWKEPNISGTIPVRPDGMISLALIGDLQAAGLTPMRLSASITDRLRKTIIDPSVTVQVTGVNSKHIFLLGEVGKQGEVPLTPGMTPLQAIASAGGLTPYANSKHIYILRGPTEKQQRIPFDYKKAVKEGNLQGVVLVPGDTIYVP